LRRGLCRRRIDQTLVDVACEATIIGTLVEVREVAFVQTKDIVPICRVGGKRHDHLDVAIADDRSVDVHSHEVVVLSLSGAYELIDGKISNRSLVSF
jgi:hypothetical protein